MAEGEAFSRVRIDAQLKDVGWDLTDGRSVRYEYPLDDGSRADYVLCDERGQALAVLEAKRTSVNLGAGERQGIAYAKALGVEFVFLANGEEVRFRDLGTDAHFRPVATLFAQDDLARRAAQRKLRRPPESVPIDGRIAGRGYQRECIETLTTAIAQGQRKLLVEMATGTGKTRVAAALIKRLFDAHAVTRVLFLVDRNTLARQTEDVFAEHLPSLATYRVPRTGERFRPEKQIAICTLQTMINEYAKYSAGYFDLIVIDECHRSIYGEYRRVLDHFDAVKLGLTATPITDQAPAARDEEYARFVRDTLRFFELQEPTFRYTIRDAVGEGYLVPYRIYRAQTIKTAASGGFEVRRDEIDWQALDEQSREELEVLFAEEDPLTVDPSALERRFTIPERNRAMVREFRDVLEHGYTGRDGVRRAPQWGKTIVFAVNKRHAETLARMFDEAFADKKEQPTDRYADFVVSGTGPDDTADAHTRIKRFTKEPLPQILVSVNMLDTGFDCPEVVNLVMARFTHSGVLYRQMRGRGTRKAEHINKADFTIFDFVGNCDYHDDDDELLFLKYMLDSLKDGGRCGVIVPEGVLFGSTGAHKELRRQLVEQNRVEAVLSLPGGVFQPYSGVKTSALVFRKGGRTERVLFLHADADGYKLDANHDTPIEEDDLPGLIEAFNDRYGGRQSWQQRDPEAPWLEKWWFATAEELREADFNLSASRWRPHAKEEVEHRDPMELLDELEAIEVEIAEEIGALKERLREDVV